jgi:uncharacterized protein YjbJ (UPF0337 family)
MDSLFAHELGFLKKLDNAMQDIMTDGKIDAHDIPTLVCLFTDMLLTSSTTSKSSKDPTTTIATELQSLFDFIMTHYRLFPADGEAALDFKKMFDACVKLVLYKPAVQKKKTSVTYTEPSRLGFFIRLCTWCTSRKKKKAEITKVVQGSGAVVNTVVQDAVSLGQDAVSLGQDAVGQVQDAVGQVQDVVQDAVSLGQDAVGQVQDVVQDAVGQVQDAVGQVQDAVGHVQDAVGQIQDTVLSAVTDGLAVIVEETSAEAEAIWATAKKSVDSPAVL